MKSREREREGSKAGCRQSEHFTMYHASFLSCNSFDSSTALWTVRKPYYTLQKRKLSPKEGILFTIAEHRPQPKFSGSGKGILQDCVSSCGTFVPINKTRIIQALKAVEEVRHCPPLMHCALRLWTLSTTSVSSSFLSSRTFCISLPIFEPQWAHTHIEAGLTKDHQQSPPLWNSVFMSQLRWKEAATHHEIGCEYPITPKKLPLLWL